jgi:acyl carrier protein
VPISGRGTSERNAASGTRSCGFDLDRIPEAEREQAVADLVLEHAAAVLGYASARDIRPDKGFDDMGFDSLGGVELRNRLSEATGLRLPSTLVFDYPAVTELARYLHGRPAAAGTAQTPAADRSAAGAAPGDLARAGSSARRRIRACSAAAGVVLRELR